MHIILAILFVSGALAYPAEKLENGGDLSDLLENIVSGIVFDIVFDFDVNEDAIEIEMTTPVVPSIPMSHVKNLKEISQYIISEFYKVDQDDEDAIEIEMTTPVVPAIPISHVKNLKEISQYIMSEFYKVDQDDEEAKL